jgi:hypothetical protein
MESAMNNPVEEMVEEVEFAVQGVVLDANDPLTSAFKKAKANYDQANSIVGYDLDKEIKEQQSSHRWQDLNEQGRERKIDQLREERARKANVFIEKARTALLEQANKVVKEATPIDASTVDNLTSEEQLARRLRIQDRLDDLEFETDGLNDNDLAFCLIAKMREAVEKKDSELIDSIMKYAKKSIVGNKLNRRAFKSLETESISPEFREKQKELVKREYAIYRFLRRYDVNTAKTILRKTKRPPTDLSEVFPGKRLAW